MAIEFVREKAFKRLFLSENCLLFALRHTGAIFVFLSKIVLPKNSSSLFFTIIFEILNNPAFEIFSKFLKYF